MSLDFVAIDFETANQQRGSVIQLGITRFLDGKKTKSATRFITPPPGLERMDPACTRVHGISASQLEGAASWPEILDGIIRFTGDLPLVGHNVSFERSCIVRASEAHDITPPDFNYFCTLKLSKKLFPNERSHSLLKLSSSLGLADFEHHDAGLDATACGDLLIELAARKGFDTFDFMPSGWLDQKRKRRTRPVTPPVIVPVAAVAPEAPAPVIVAAGTPVTAAAFPLLAGLEHEAWS